MWADNELAGDIWNGRWSKHTLAEILGEKGMTTVSRKAYASGTRKIAAITKLMQTAQRELYSVWRSILQAEHQTAPMPHVSWRRKRPRDPRSLTLLEAWKLPYSRPKATPNHSTDFCREDCMPQLLADRSPASPARPPQRHAHK
jgi:hypothetical protein